MASNGSQALDIPLGTGIYVMCIRSIQNDWATRVKVPWIGN
jgi:hypothetical protein